MEDISMIKEDIDSKLEREMTNLSLLKETLSRSNTNTQNMLGILNSFESRLKKMESTIVPVYNETENLRCRQENLEKVMITLENVLGYYHVSQEIGMLIKEGPESVGLDRYIAQMDKLLSALSYFKKSSQNSFEFGELAQLFDKGIQLLNGYFQTLLLRHGRPVPPIIILDMIAPDEELSDESEVPLEHLPAKVIDDLSDIARWLAANTVDPPFTKEYVSSRSIILTSSLKGLKEHLKSASGLSTTISVAPHSPAMSRQFKPSKDTPARMNIKRIVQYTKKASTGLLKSPFEPGHRRQGSNTDTYKEEGPDIDIEIYITELSALQKLMQSELQLLNRIIPEKLQRSTFDTVVQPGLEVVYQEGEALANNAKKCIGKHEFTAVVSIFPVVRHLRAIKPETDRLLEGCQAPTRAKLAGLLSLLGSTGAKAMEEFVTNIKTDQQTNLPKDGTVHQLTSQTLIFLEQLRDYSDTVGAMLLMHGEQAAPTEAVDEKKSRMKLADYITKVLSSLGLSLSNKAENYSDIHLRPILMLNNYNYIIKSLKRSGLIDLVHQLNSKVESYYDDQILEQKKAYSQSWSKVMHYLLEVNEPMSVQRTMNPDTKLKEKERQNIKDKFSGFNKELEDIFRIQKAYAIPDTELRAQLKKDNVEFILPSYKIFLEKYQRLNFTKNPEKYIKYKVEDVEAILNKFFDAAA
ncbi:hypothetical protein ACJMK2_034802 [Sinanodonta woodiana]|uniref:Exocyst complex component 7 n=1 Tax=Sinanodonta woodiana TaxID=1069815 RepID=A0ABD3WTC3_SINWO